jgi:hypothetical protein
MYGYQLKNNKRIYFLNDFQVPDKPEEFLNGENIRYWWHKKDGENVIDIFWENENISKEETDKIDG